MANLNHTGAFATVEPTKGDMTDWVGKVFKPLQDNLDKEKSKRGEAKKQLFEAYKNKTEFEIPKGFEINSTQEIVNSALPVLLDAYREISTERDNAFAMDDLNGVLLANRNLDNLKNSGKFIKEALTSIEKDGLLLQEGFASGKLYLTKENIEKMGSFAFDKMHFMFDKQKGELLVAFQDVNQDGVIDEKDRQSLSEFINIKNLNFGKPAKVFSLDDKAKDIGTKLGKYVQQGFDSSGRKYSKQRLEDDLSQFSLNQEELYYLRAVDGDNAKSDEEYQQLYKEKIRSYIDNKEEVFGGGASGRGDSGRGGVNKGKILYVDRKTGIDKTFAGPRKPGQYNGDYHELTISGGGHKLADKYTGIGMEGVIDLISFYPEDDNRIVLYGNVITKKTLGSSDIHKVSNSPLTTVQYETKNEYWDNKNEVLSILSVYFDGVKSYKQLVEKLKEIIKENEDDYGVKK